MENFLCSAYCDKPAEFVCLCNLKYKCCGAHRDQCPSNSHHEFSLFYIPGDRFIPQIDSWIEAYESAYIESTKEFSEYLKQLFDLKRNIEDSVIKQLEDFENMKAMNHPEGPSPVLSQNHQSLQVDKLNSRNVVAFFSQNIFYGLLPKENVLMGRKQIENRERFLKIRLDSFRKAFAEYFKEFGFKTSYFVSSIEKKLLKMIELKRAEFIHLCDRKFLFKILIFNCDWDKISLNIENLDSYSDPSRLVKRLKCQDGLDFICKQFHRIYSSEFPVTEDRATLRKGHIKVLKYILKLQNFPHFKNFFIAKRKEIKIVDIRNSNNFHYILICNPNLGDP